MRLMLLIVALILAGCGPSTSPNPPPGDTPGPTPSMGAPTPTDGGAASTLQRPSDFPPAPANAKIDTTANGTGTPAVPESQVPGEIASLIISDDSGAGGGGGPPHPNTPTKAVDATTGLCIAGTELSGEAPVDVSCDWAYVCVTPNGTTQRQGTKDLDTKCNPTKAAMSFGNNLGNALSQSCLVYQYWFWCTW